MTKISQKFYDDLEDCLSKGIKEELKCTKIVASKMQTKESTYNQLNFATNRQHISWCSLSISHNESCYILQKLFEAWAAYFWLFWLGLICPQKEASVGQSKRVFTMGFRGWVIGYLTISIFDFFLKFFILNLQQKNEFFSKFKTPSFLILFQKKHSIVMIRRPTQNHRAPTIIVLSNFRKFQFSAPIFHLYDFVKLFPCTHA